MTRRIALIAMMLALAACTKEVKPEEAISSVGPMPLDYKAQIIANAKSNYFDPYSIRSAEISKPVPAKNELYGKYAWVVCVKANAKNRFGAYVGQQLDGYVFQNGKITQKSGHPETYCDGKPFEAFPELESIK